MFDIAAANRLKIYCRTSFPFGIVPMVAGSKSPNFGPQTKKAAVFIPITNYCGEPAIIFTLRSNSVGTHKGQVSFPGGHLEKHESPIDAALREPNEELGIDIDSLECLEVCQTIPAITGTAVTPVIGHVYINFDLDYGSKLQVNENEVERVFFRTIKELLLDRTTETLSRDGITMDFPVFGANHKNKEEKIWGLTAFILGAVIDKVLMPSFIKPTSSEDFPPGF